MSTSLFQGFQFFKSAFSSVCCIVTGLLCRMVTGSLSQPSMGSTVVLYTGAVKEDNLE